MSVPCCGCVVAVLWPCCVVWWLCCGYAGVVLLGVSVTNVVVVSRVCSGCVVLEFVQIVLVVL